MTIEAEIAKQNAVNFEAKKDGLKQVQSGDVKVTFTVKADDMPPSLYSDLMGQRYVIALVALNDDETAREKPKSLAGSAKMMAQDELFWRFLSSFPPDYMFVISEQEAEKYIEQYCDVESCSEIIEGTEAGKKFKQLQAKFMEWKNG